MVNEKNNIYIFIWSLSIFFALGSCTDNFSEINTPDDQIISDNVGAGQLGQAFAQAQYQGNLGRASGGAFQLIHSLYGDIYAQYFATTAKNFDSDQYKEIGSWSDGGWNDFYGNAAPQLDFVTSFTAENDMKEENAIANIYKVQFYQRVTDLWGPIIYSEFGNGETSVSYDTQKSVYMDFFEKLSEARSVLQNTDRETAFAQNDLIFEGDISKWIKFANSIQLRAAMRIRYVDPAKAKTEAEEALNPANGGVMTSNADNATVKTSENNRNPYSTITDWGEFRMSAAMESTLEGYNDLRLSEYFKPAADGDTDGDGSPYEGFRNGVPKAQKDQGALNAGHSDMATKYLSAQLGGQNPPIAVMDVSEVNFLRAEGDLIGWNMGGGTAQSFYEDGIRTSLQKTTNASSSDITAYINSTDTPKAPQGSGNYNYNLPPLSNVQVVFDNSGTQEEKLEQIITQKWIALYPNSLEAYAELRRTGYPRQYERVNSLNLNIGPGEIFRRLTFVTSELSNNNQAVTSAQELEELANGDVNYSRVWWDAKPLAEYPDFVSP